FLAELDTAFKHRDLRNECIVDEDNTIGLQIIEPQSKTRLSSLAHQVIAEEKLSALLAEEMR
ncbi:unnamed protein product, partial [marine sediment metagenome]